MGRIVRLATFAALLAALSPAGLARCAEPAPSPAAVQPALAGRWVGAKLRCQKDEGKLVRCGTPTAFEISFDEAGAGATPDENLPKSFMWRWRAAGEIGLTPAGGGEELKLFSVERDADALSFQAYIFLPTADPNAPAEARYIHYVFDVNRAEQ